MKKDKIVNMLVNNKYITWYLNEIPYLKVTLRISIALKDSLQSK